MRKRIFALMFMLMFAVILVACGGEEEIPTVIPTPEPTLSAITFSGANDVTIAFESEFNVFTGVTALGDDGVNYTAKMTFLSTAPIDNAGNLDTTNTGVHAVRYEVREGEVLAQRWRYITVEAPDRPEGLVVNGDFALGTVFWDDGANGFYVADGAALDLSIEDGALKAEVTAGSNVWTPRFGQQGIPFVEGQAYEVTFRAKSSVVKTINVQVGELISMAPWFVDFKQGQTEHHQITTEWATYTFKFFMNMDNQRGGILFEMGNVLPEGQLDATIWFDDIVITETEMGEDVIAPVISGVSSAKTIAAGETFDVLDGVTAMDNIDGVITDAITVEYFLVDGETETPVTVLDLTEEAVYKIVYTVSDAAGNVTSEEMLLTVVLVIVLEYPGWRTFLNDWAGTAGELVFEDNQLTLNLSVISTDENWQIQVIQDAFALGYGEDNVGSMNLEAGATYRVTFDAKASVAGNIALAIGHAGGGWTPYFVNGEVAVTTVMQTFVIEFTLDDDAADYSVPAQFKLEMGLLFTGQTEPQSFTLANVMIEVKDGENFVATELIFNGEMAPTAPMVYAINEWRGFANTWEGTAYELTGVSGQLKLKVSNISAMDLNWKIQVIQDAFALGTGEDNVGSIQFEAGKSYRVSFDARASVAGNITLAIGHSQGGWTPYFAKDDFAVTTQMQTFSVDFTLNDPEADYTVLAQFKLEMGLLFANESEGLFFLDNVLIEVLEGDAYVDAELIVNGSMSNTRVYFYNNLGWTTVNAYIFGDAGEIFGGWPGSVATKDGDSNWYYVDVPLDPATTVINIIFNNGSGAQTADIVIGDAVNVYIASNNMVYATRAEAEAAVAE